MSNIDQTYAQIAEFARKHGVRRIILFGSRVRGDELAKSDIDLAVEGCPNFDAFESDVQEKLFISQLIGKLQCQFFQCCG